MSQLLQSTGGPPLPPVYGLGAVLLAHVFFNAPLMLRVLSGTLGGIPQAQWRLAAQWGLSDLERFAKIEWPTLKRVIPGLLALVFLLCFTSFSLVLMLGGGPAVTTLEVSIYTALRFDFDLPMAGKLALLQLMICAGVVILLTMLTGRSWPGAAGKTGQTVLQRGDNALSTRITDGVILAIFVCVTVLPLFAILWRGISPKLAAVLAWPAFWQATFTSLSIAVLSGILATGIALVLASARSRRAVASLAVWPLDLAISLYLAVSAIVLGTGMFILLRTVADVFLLAPLLVLLGNMLVSLPFAYRILEGRLASLASIQDRLCAALDIRGWRRFSLVTLPALAPEIGYAAGLSSALSLGDMTIVALFGSQQFQTLPWLLYQTMARYRAGEAAALALLLLCLTLLLFTLFVLSAKLAGRRNYA
ncbi:MAG: ABC transporter permease subunit [Candidatus Puniceispirillaceae bacterium]